jgi:hypothetical protein
MLTCLELDDPKVPLHRTVSRLSRPSLERTLKEYHVEHLRTGKRVAKSQLLSFRDILRETRTVLAGMHTGCGTVFDSLG